MSITKNFCKTALFSILYGNSLFADPAVFDAIIQKSKKVIEQRDEKQAEIEKMKQQYNNPLILQAIQDVESRKGITFKAQLSYNTYYTSDGFKKETMRMVRRLGFYSRESVLTPINWAELRLPELYESLIELENQVQDFLATGED